MTQQEYQQKPTKCALHRRMKGNHKCMKTWQGCILYGMYNDYCPDYQSKNNKNG